MQNRAARLSQYSKQLSELLIYVVLCLALFNLKPISQLSFSFPVENCVDLSAFFIVLSIAGSAIHKVRWPLVFLFSLLFLFQLGEGIALEFFNRGLLLPSDFAALVNLYDLFSFTQSSISFFALAVLGLIASLLVGLFLVFGGAYVFSGLGWPTRSVALLLGILFVAQNPSARKSSYISRLKFAFRNPEPTEQEKKIQQMSEKMEQYQLDLNGANVYVFFIESYGGVLHRHRQTEKEFRLRLMAVERRLQEAGFYMATLPVTASTFGGMSWIPEMSFYCGVPLENSVQYENFKKQPRACFSHLLGAMNYQIINAKAGTTWLPKDNFYQYDKRYYSKNAEYEGRHYDFAHIADQYLIDYVDRKSLAPMREKGQPYFFNFFTANSHAHWSRIPNYIKDWGKLKDSKETFSKENLRTFSTHSVEGYLSAIEYNLKVISDFLIQTNDERALAIVLGDHQPPRLVDEELSYDVPFHIVVKQKALLQRLTDDQWNPGLSIFKHAKAIKSHDIMHEILKKLSAEDTSTEPGK